MMELWNITLRIPLLLWSPYIQQCSVQEKTLLPTKTCPRPGYNNEILGEILRYLNVSYELFPLDNNTQWGHKDSGGNWNGVLGDVISGKYDMSSGMMIITESRASDFEFSYPVGFVRPTIFFQKGKPIVADAWLIHVFNYKVWGSFIGMALLLSLVSAFCVMASSHVPADWSVGELRHQMWLSWTFFTDQTYLDITDERVKRSSAVYILLVLLGLESLFFIGNYQGSLLTVLLNENKLDTIAGGNDLARKVKDGTKTIISMPGSAFEELIRDSPHPVYQHLSAAVAVNPIQTRNGDEFSLAEEVAKDSSLVLAFATPLNAIQTQQKICNSDYTELWDVPPQYVVFMFRKNDDRYAMLQNKINEQLTYFTFIEHIYAKYAEVGVVEKAGCEAENSNIASLNLESLTPLFWLVTGGGIAGAACIVLELFRHWYSAPPNLDMVENAVNAVQHVEKTVEGMQDKIFQFGTNIIDKVHYDATHVHTHTDLSYSSLH